MTQRKSVALEAVSQLRGYLRVPRLDSIKSRILALALLGTLLPAATTMVVAYVQNRRALEAKITQDLLAESSQTAGALSIWLKARLLDLKVFAGSEEVATNLATNSGQGASARLAEYLRSVHERIPDFEELMVLDASGRVVASSAARIHQVQLPARWRNTITREGQVVGDAFWDERARKAKLVVAVPVTRIDGRLLGAFAVEINLLPLQSTLRQYLRDTVNGRIFVVTDSGAVVAASSGVTAEILRTKLRPSIARRVRASESAGISYWNLEGREVVGAVKAVPQVQGWSVLAELSSDLAFEQLRHFRNVAFGLVIVLLVFFGATAWRLGILIVRPLEQLAQGAHEVAHGDLKIDLPESRIGEVGALTRVFNDMVERIRHARQELADANVRLREKNEALERLSVTDGLTGLANHRALMQRLEQEAQRALRNGRPFTAIMADVDHFKQYNDTFGHPQGDEVLRQVAGVLTDATRSVDCVARYGGEEFAILLPDTGIDGALEVAERVRAQVEQAEFPGRRVTLSLGVAEFPKHAADGPAVLAAADAALYIAKRGGRNQVAQAVAPAPEKTLPPASRRRAAKKRG